LRALLTQASLQTRIATGPEAGHKWKRLGDRVEPEAQTPGSQPRNADAHKAIAQHGEMSLHADVAVPANDRNRLERLCRSPMTASLHTLTAP